MSGSNLQSSPLFEHTEPLPQDHPKGPQLGYQTLMKRSPAHYQGQGFETELEGNFEVDSCSRMLIDLVPLRFQVQRDAMKIGLPPQSTMWSSVPRAAMKISLPCRGTWSYFVEPTKEDKMLGHERNEKDQKGVNQVVQGSALTYHER